MNIYHYTSFEAFCKIIKSNKFLFSNFANANDYKEKAFLRKEEIEKFRYLSCSVDVTDLYSYTNPPLWYFYADKGHGFCLCFDKTKLLNKINVVKEGFIEYRDGVTHIDNQAIIEYLMEKRKAWSYEKEYRIIVAADCISLQNIFECINAVYIGSDIVEKEIESVYKYIPETIGIYKMYIDKIDGRYNCIDYRKKIALNKKCNVGSMQ